MGRNQEKYDMAHRALGTKTDEVMQLVNAFDVMKKSVVDDVMKSFDSREAVWFEKTATTLNMQNMPEGQ